MDEAQLKKTIAKQLGIPQKLSKRIWNALTAKRLVEVALKADEFELEVELEILVAEYKFLSNFARGAYNEPGVEVTVDDSDQRLLALARIVAIEADRSAAVAAFRGEHLRDGLIEVGDTERWVRDHEAEEGPHAARERLAFFNGEHVAQVLATPGSVLGDLKKVCRALETTYGWSEPAAVLFVLTGMTLALPNARVSIHRRHPHTALSRINHRGHPRMAPRRVQELYSAARLQLRKGGDKDILPKHAALAVFAAEQGLRASQAPAVAMLSIKDQDELVGESPAYASWPTSTPFSRPGRTWAGRRSCRSGTNAHPEWAYNNINSVKDFGRDVRAAWLRVTGEPWEPRKTQKTMETQDRDLPALLQQAS